MPFTPMALETNVFRCASRSKCSALSLPSNETIPFLVNMSPRTANLDISMTTPFLLTPSARPSRRPHCGSTTPDGKAFRSSSRLGKVCLFHVMRGKIQSNDTILAALNESKVEVRIQFKDVTQGIFKDIARNELVIRIQPNEAVYLKLNSKTPGLYTRAIPTEMDLTYKRRFLEPKIPEAYEALILDALRGDHSNFVRHDELDVAWKVSISQSQFLCCSRVLTILEDFHTNLALDRRFEWTSPTPSAIPLRIARS